MQDNNSTLTETERNTLFITVHGYEFRLWLNQVTSTPYWQVDTRETDGSWIFHSCAYGLTEAFNGIRVATGL
jgi:hypothetical protein